MLKKIRPQTGHSLRTDLLLIGKGGNTGMLRNTCFKQRRIRRVRAYPVIVAVSADHAAVKPNLARAGGGHRGKLCRNKIRFGYTVLFVKQRKNLKLRAFFRVKRLASGDEVKLLARYSLGQRFCNLILRYMRH